MKRAIYRSVAASSVLLQQRLQTTSLHLHLLPIRQAAGQAARRATIVTHVGQSTTVSIQEAAQLLRKVIRADQVSQLARVQSSRLWHHDWLLRVKRILDLACPALQRWVVELLLRGALIFVCGV